jgi:hypothetical protein
MQAASPSPPPRRSRRPLSSDARSLIGATLVLLLGAVIASAAWFGWEASRGSASEREAARSAGTGDRPPAVAAGDRPEEGSATAEEPIGSGEGASLTGHDHGDPEALTPAEARIVEKQLAEAKAAATRYANIDAARRDGFFQVTQFIPGLGMHLANLGIPTHTFDAGRPNVLLYEPDGTGGHRLAGVAYTVRKVDDVPPEGFAGGSDVWHFHRNLCFVPGGTVGIAPNRAACDARGGIFQEETDWLLHAWLWVPNPGGVFVEVNPKVTGLG